MFLRADFSKTTLDSQRGFACPLTCVENSGNQLEIVGKRIEKMLESTDFPNFSNNCFSVVYLWGSNK
jgi:hypothetical protein